MPLVRKLRFEIKHFPSNKTSNMTNQQSTNEYSS